MPPSTKEKSNRSDHIFAARYIAMMIVFWSLVIWVIVAINSLTDTTPKVRIYAFTLSARLATSGSNSTATEPPPLTANCTAVFAFDNNKRNVFGYDYSGVLYEYDEIEASVVWGGRNETLMRANLETVLQGSPEKKPVLLVATDLFVPPHLQWTVDYTLFTVNVKTRVRAQVGTEDENVFYLEATCDEVKIGLSESVSGDRVAAMMDGPLMCRAVELKSSFDV
ncbi:unnamed protein product [Cuscuta epithymum]|uniref:Late embryogenesis abundant protein LEA-2 subgroup domain-containing protein n=1 Tax=Cuscuta epithymum TaxID=186058 RepID=A0AAV0DQF7_9ASTE|nr:unnamed protein product [Cuscuta epithymum]